MGLLVAIVSGFVIGKLKMENYLEDWVQKIQAGPIASHVVMKNVKILGTGYANCRHTISLVEAVTREKNVQITLEKVEELPSIMSYGLMSTPCVVIDDVLVHAGGVPSRGKVEGWF